ncbi:uncharacterized protein LOC132187920 [Corylus avellana]|uniref:uncharacterized protein LOC132187920 n=1 Tax=Corylus avellana TaxID=13451 RepID=UPI00286B2B79|nr:uncharacterized protein LOC132187920 [Corylus avellana]
MLVKSVLPQNHALDLQEMFTTLKRYRMKLNLSKCAFGVLSRKFLDYMVSSRGIEANPKKIQVVLDMQSPKNLKQLQRLMGRIAALNRFISRSTDKSKEVSDEPTFAKPDNIWRSVVSVLSCIVKIPRPENERLDRVARTDSTVDGDTKDETPIQILSQSSITEMVSVSTAETIPDWQLEKGVLHSDRKLTTRLRIRAARFTMVNGTLYKRGFMLPLLKCVSREEGNYILREIHEGICGSHSGARILAHKVVQASFYWPNMCRDSELVRDCYKCHRFANVTHQLPEDLSAISSPWPFSQ